jgi:hypothetical protein
MLSKRQFCVWLFSLVFMTGPAIGNLRAASSQALPPPLTKEQVLSLGRNRLADEAGAKAIEQRGIDFQPTEDLLQGLESAGTAQVFIQALRNAKRPQAGPGAADEPLDPIQILIMVFDGVDEQRIITMVNQRGISGHVDHDTLEMMRALVLPFQGKGAAARDPLDILGQVEPDLRARLERTPQSASLREQLAFVQALEGSYTRFQMAANQASTVGSLRTLNVAAITYASTYNVGFPPGLAALRPPDGQGAPTADTAGLVDPVLASGKKDGYIFTYRPGVKNSMGQITTYTIHADPITPGTTGTEHFFTDQSGWIRREINKPANEQSPPIAG